MVRSQRSSGTTVSVTGIFLSPTTIFANSPIVIPLERWERTMWFDQTGLPWINPSPNIRSLTEALLYSGVGLLEATNLSVGRGTQMPFEVVGAPWISDPKGLADALNALGMAGVTFQPVNFQPDSSVYAGQMVGGVRLVVT